MASKNFFSLPSIKNQSTDSNGIITRVTSQEMPGLVKISFSNLKLNPGSFLNPIWHPNAHKIGYCLEGKALVSIRTPSGVEVFTINEGDVFFIPKGYVHHLINTGHKDNQIIFALDHHLPEEMSFFQAVQSLSDSVFATTFETPSDFLNGLKKSKNGNLFSSLGLGKKEPDFISSRYKFNLGSSSKVIMTKGGYVQSATKTNLPILEGLGILGFGLTSRGVVEPHWHTNAGELIYIIKGSARVTVLAPDGSLDVLEVKGGEGAFAAASHFHNIENIGDDDLEVMAFFSHADPDFIGIGEVMGSYSNAELASIFHVSPTYFDHFKKPNGPLVIVPL